jgi:hypothetical protein
LIAAIDTETQGLDCTKFITGCLLKQNTKKPKIYDTKQAMWQDILRIGRKEKHRGKTLTIYAHHMAYDFYAIADLEDTNLQILSQKPFIASYNENNQETIKFLDTMNLYPMSLKKVGEIIGLHKIDTPNILKEGQKPTAFELNLIKQYMLRDTQIVLKSVQYIKQKIKKENINIKRLITIHQIAVQYLINKLKLEPNAHTIFSNTKKGITHHGQQPTTPKQTKYYNTIFQKIHQAYRGGRVEAWQTGEIKNTNYIDCNSLYPYSSTQINFPDITTQHTLYQPLTTHTKKEILEMNGISECMITNHTNEIGLLQIRTGEENYIPKSGTTFIGTWTNIELKKAEQEGYEIHHIEWTIKYKTTTNPFKNITPTLYKRRKESNTTFDNYFYKMMMNASYGKLAQTKTGKKILIDSVENAKDYLKENYKIIKGINYNYMYEQQPNNNPNKKKYYLPIIPTLINAHARIYMYDQYKKIGIKNLIYTDTDSIIFTGPIPNTIKINKELGQFKIEHANETITIYGKKTYQIGNTTKIVGINRRNITGQAFQQGIIHDQKMITHKQAKNKNQIGTFRTETRNLKKQLQNHKLTQKLLSKEKILIDKKNLNISPYIPIIAEKFK